MTERKCETCQHFHFPDPTYTCNRDLDNGCDEPSFKKWVEKGSEDLATQNKKLREMVSTLLAVAHPEREISVDDYVAGWKEN